MAKRLLALLLSVCMVFSVCTVSIFAEESTDEDDANTVEAMEVQPESDYTEPEDSKEDDPKEDDISGDVTVKKTVTLNMDRTYLPNATVVIKGEITGDISGVIVTVECAEDRVLAKDTATTISASKFVSTGYKYMLDGATVGAEYVVKVYDFEDEEIMYAVDSFVIKKDSYVPDREDDGSNKVKFWIEGLTDRYVDETTVSLDMLKSSERTVLGVAEYVLDDVDRNYRLNTAKTKIDRIATTATGSTYLRDNASTNSAQKNCVWGYFLNGVEYFDVDMCDMEVKGGDEIILYFGEPGKVGYPVVKVEPENGISLNDTVEVTVEKQMTDVNTGEVTREPIKSAKVYIMKRDATSKGTAHSTDSKGVYSVKATSSFISTYQGGKVMVAYYQTSSKPPLMVSVTRDLETDRDGYVRASVTVEGAHKTLLEKMTPASSAKIEEYDLLNYTIEVFKSKKIDYELNRDENNFVYIESKTTSGYSNENGDLTRDSGWYVSVNGKVYTPDDDLEDVAVFTGDDIIYYFGDSHTVYAYHKVDGTLKTDETVYVYFYSDPDMTEPISGLTVYFSGDDINKKLKTNTNGRIALPVVDYKGTYTLEWGEQVGVKDDHCPEAVYREVELTYTGTSKPTNSGNTTTVKPTEKKTDPPTEKKTNKNDPDDWPTTKPDDSKNERPTWNEGDIIDPTEPNKEKPTGPSPYFPDQNISGWSVPFVNKAYEYKLMKGTAYGYFEPQREITRAEFAVIICNILGLDAAKDNYTPQFADVPYGSWCYGYVMAAYSAGYVTGRNATTFDPGNYITREEIAVIISRILGVTGEEVGVFMFADGYNVSLWARIYVTAVHESGIMVGDEAGRFNPQNKVTREAAATVAVRLYELLYS